MAKKVSKAAIINAHKGLIKTASNDSVKLKDNFNVRFDKEYPKDHIITGDMKVTVESISDGKIVEKVIFSGRKTWANNKKRINAGAFKIFQEHLKGKSPGTVYFSNCKVAGKASIPEVYRE